MLLIDRGIQRMNFERFFARFLQDITSAPRSSFYTLSSCWPTSITRSPLTTHRGYPSTLSTIHKFGFLGSRVSNIAEVKSVHTERRRLFLHGLMDNTVLCTDVNYCQNRCLRRSFGDEKLPSDGANLSSTSEERKMTTGSTVAQTETKRSLFQRFRDTYRQYGKILIAVHVVTSAMWFGIFYYAAYSGLDVVPLMKWFNLPESIIHPFTLPHVGSTAVMYLLYKVATPVRYPVTILGTQLAARLLRRGGYLPQIAPENTLRSLVRDGRIQMKDNARVREERRRKSPTRNKGKNA